MKKLDSERLSGRERQIMNAAYRLGPASAVDICREIEDPPSLSTVRKIIRILEGKGYLEHSRDGKKHIYTPTEDRVEASQSALQHLVQTFFNGSVSATVTALFNTTRDELTVDDAAELSALINEQARKENRS